MHLNELDDIQRLALVGLAKLVVRADSDLSAGEKDALDLLATEVGIDAFRASLQRAAETLRTSADAMKAAEAVTGPAARKAIFAALEKLAATGGVVAAEREILDWLRRTWQLDS